MKGRDRSMNKIVRLAVLGVFGAGLALGGSAACASGPAYAQTSYDDCDPEDQQGREDDCGYWHYDGLYSTGVMPGVGAVWMYWSWVVPGTVSFAPAGWTPPHGLKAPAASEETKTKYKSHQKKQREAEKKAREKAKNNKPADSVKNGNQPKSGGGNQSVPKNNPAPKAPARPASKPR